MKLISQFDSKLKANPSSVVLFCPLRETNRLKYSQRPEFAPAFTNQGLVRGQLMKRSASTDKMLTAWTKNYVRVSPQNFISQSQMVASCTGNSYDWVFDLHILKSLGEPGSPIPKVSSKKVLCYLSVGGYRHKFWNYRILFFTTRGINFETKQNTGGTKC